MKVNGWCMRRLLAQLLPTDFVSLKLKLNTSLAKGVTITNGVHNVMPFKPISVQ